MAVGTDVASSVSVVGSGLILPLKVGCSTVGGCKDATRETDDDSLIVVGPTDCTSVAVKRNVAWCVAVLHDECIPPSKVGFSAIGGRNGATREEAGDRFVERKVID